MKFYSVYVIYNPVTKYVKIGITTDLKKRMYALSYASGVHLELKYHTYPCYNACNIEDILHNDYKPFNTFGEWFNITIDDAITNLSGRTVQIVPMALDYVNKLSVKDIASKHGKSRQAIEQFIKQYDLSNAGGVISQVIPVEQKIIDTKPTPKHSTNPITSSISKERLEEMVRINNMKLGRKTIL